MVSSPECLCALCKERLGDSPVFCFRDVPVSIGEVMFYDNCAHRSCLKQWDRLTQFAKAYNRAIDEEGLEYARLCVLEGNDLAIRTPRDSRQQPWSFVAMEYYALIMNRTFLVTVDADSLTAVKCRGLTTVGGYDPLTMLLLDRTVPRGDLADPRTYVDHAPAFGRSRSDFRWPIRAINTVRFDPRKKWGMGPYPHDGRVYLASKGSARELIILGRQSGGEITQDLRAAMDRVWSEAGES